MKSVMSAADSDISSWYSLHWSVLDVEFNSASNRLSFKQIVSEKYGVWVKIKGVTFAYRSQERERKIRSKQKEKQKYVNILIYLKKARKYNLWQRSERKLNQMHFYLNQGFKGIFSSGYQSTNTTASNYCDALTHKLAFALIIVQLIPVVILY